MPLFELGTVEITARAAAALGADAESYLARHQAGDWGDDAEDSAHADFALRFGHTITSNYRLTEQANLLIITGADRRLTRLLLAEEFEQREVNLREGYAIWSAFYDSEKNALIDVEQPRVDALLTRLSFSSVLDVGSGTGRQALRLARQGAQVTAIDPSPEMMALAQQTAAREGLALDFRLGALEDGLPFENEQFDLVICALVLCHIADLKQAAAEMSRVLKPGGHLLITDFHPEVVALGWRSVFFQPGVGYRLPNSGASRVDYLDALAASGLQVQTIQDITLREVPEGFFPPMGLEEIGGAGFCLIILSQKPLEGEVRPHRR